MSIHQAPVDIVPVGDAAAMAMLGDSIDLGVVRRVWALSALASARLGSSVLDVVPAYASVLVRFDPMHVSLANVMAVLRGAARDSAEAPVFAARRIRVGVSFGGEHGEDLEQTARDAGLSAAEYVKAMCAADYSVAFLGFRAGFPYMLGLPPRLAAPRLPSPRDRVPAGSVAIAGTQCGIYPRISPGGWRLLGRTSASIFDAERELPALFAPGDSVRFEAVKRLSDAVAEVSW